MQRTILSLALVTTLHAVYGCKGEEPPTPPTEQIVGTPLDAPIASVEPQSKAPQGLPATDATGLQVVPFQFLASFEYVYPEPGQERPIRNQIPASVLALQKQTIAVDGFILPTELQDGKVKRFLLSRYPFGCCFGQGPSTNEYVDVTVPGAEGLESIPFQAARVIGPIEVGEVKDDAGYVTSVYRMTAESVSEAPDMTNPDHHAGGQGGQ